MARYTHRVAISNSCLLAIDGGVSFRWKDYRVDGPARIKVMTLTHDEFIRRFLIHVLPASLHRIRHYGLFAKKPGRAQPRDEHGNCSSASSRGAGFVSVSGETFAGSFQLSMQKSLLGHPQCWRQVELVRTWASRALASAGQCRRLVEKARIVDLLDKKVPHRRAR